METVHINGKTFKKYISDKEIQEVIAHLAKDIDRDLADKNPLVICILNGAIIFAADLVRNMSTPCQLSTMRVKSYDGEKTTGKVTTLTGVDPKEVEGRTLLVVEDIVDTGLSMKHIVASLTKLNPKEIKIATLLSKPSNRVCQVEVDYIALTIPNKFVVGYGLDYNEMGRTLRHIYVIE